MSTVGVVSYSVPMYKSNILQQTNNGNRECKDGSVRKAQHILPQTKDFPKDDMLSNVVAKKKPRNAKEMAKTNPQLVSVARRNARERNRVKQVNNGFANLRERIPNFIASTFESGRGGNKKLSKVETLRMAVEYIRSLEDLLALEENDSENISHSSVTSFQSTTSPPSMSQQNNMTYQYADDDISTNSSPPPQQYVRINTANNTYQIIPAEMYDDSENYEPLDPADHILPDPSLMSTDLDFREMHDMSIIDSRDSLSPGMYSDQSFSPNEIDKIEQKCFVPVFNTQVNTIDNFKLTAIKTEVISEPPLLSLKSESELPEEHINVIQWWEQQPRTTRS